MRPRGFYWVRFKDDSDGWTIGCYHPKSFYPWEVIGSDESFQERSLEIGPRIDEPNIGPIDYRDE